METSESLYVHSTDILPPLLLPPSTSLLVILICNSPLFTWWTLPRSPHCEPYIATVECVCVSTCVWSDRRSSWNEKPKEEEALRGKRRTQRHGAGCDGEPVEALGCLHQRSGSAVLSPPLLLFLLPLWRLKAPPYVTERGGWGHKVREADLVYRCVDLLSRVSRVCGSVTEAALCSWNTSNYDRSVTCNRMLWRLSFKHMCLLNGSSKGSFKGIGLSEEAVIELHV